MSTAQILFEQYKVLPKKIKKQLRALIEEEEEKKEYVEISLPHFKDAVRQVKLLKEGKLKTTDAREFLKQLESELPEGYPFNYLVNSKETGNGFSKNPHPAKRGQSPAGGTGKQSH